MEIIRNGPDQVIMPSIRQADLWAEYLKFLGWEIIETNSGTKLFFMKSFLGTLCKIQKPKIIKKRELNEIEKIANKKKSIFIKIEPGYGQDNKLFQENEYVTSNFPLSPPSTLIIDLTKSEKELWNDLSRSGKYSTRRAQREGAVMKYFRNPNDDCLKRFFEIEVATGKRGRFYIQPFKDLQEKRNVFKEDSILIEVYDSNENLLSAKFYLVDGPFVTYIHGGTSELGRKSKGGYELMWKSILYLKKLGFQQLDLEGIDDQRFPQFTKDWGGFSHFKEKFGGIHVEFPLPHIKYNSKILKVMSRLHKLPL
ncbi:peptidoglycan bridge formation glycyltransferase FemA/FemB family protein [Patescibacteria group bacterium]